MTEHARMKKKFMHENTINHCAMCDIQAGAEEYDMHMIKVHKHPGKDINHSRTKMPSKRPKKNVTFAT